MKVGQKNKGEIQLNKPNRNTNYRCSTSYNNTENHKVGIFLGCCSFQLWAPRDLFPLIKHIFSIYFLGLEPSNDHQQWQGESFERIHLPSEIMLIFALSGILASEKKSPCIPVCCSLQNTLWMKQVDTSSRIRLPRSKWSSRWPCAGLCREESCIKGRGDMEGGKAQN